MTMLLEFLERHRARHLFRSSHLKRGTFTVGGILGNVFLFSAYRVTRSQVE